MGKKLQMHYNTPAVQLSEQLPIGNGRLGTMLSGGVTDENLLINEETVWAGNRNARTNHKAYDALQKVREAIFTGDIVKAENYGKDMMGVPQVLQSYQPLCSMTIHMECKFVYKHYDRYLDLDEGIYRQTSVFMREVVTSETESFADMADDILVWRRRIDGAPEPVDIICGLHRTSEVSISAEGNTLSLSGSVEGGGVDFCCMARIYSDGEIISNGYELLIHNAHWIEVRIAGATNYFGEEPIAKCKEYLDCVEGIDYNILRARHTAAFKEKMGRQSFSLDCGEITRTVPELLLDSKNNTAARDQVCTLFFAYLRYLMISSSRPGGVPSNLQGIWNDNMHAACNSDYHPNINMQINYWSAEGFNLPECVEPVVDWMKMIAVSGEKTAREHYNAGGWVLHHVSDIYGCTTPMDGPWGIWPFGGIWMLRTLYEHYLYAPDETYLKETLLPLIEGAVRFILDYLVECPAGIPGEGKLVTCPSHSPENGYLDKNGNRVYLTYAATMDIELIHDLFMMYETCLQWSGTEGKYLDEALAAKERLPEISISKRYGTICEWIDDFEESEPGHRHVAHMFAVYPGTEINEGTPELLEAAKRTLERRLTHNYDGQGWSYGWIGCLYARMCDGNSALRIIERMMDETLLPNLIVVAHGRQWVADAQVFGAAVLEMLVQSHEDVIRLLPALPDRWANGEITGLRVRGGHLIDMQWRNGEITEVSFTAASDGILHLRTKNADKLFSGLENDGTVYWFRAEKGKTYRFSR